MRVIRPSLWPKGVRMLACSVAQHSGPKAERLNPSRKGFLQEPTWYLLQSRYKVPVFKETCAGGVCDDKL